MSKNIVIKIHKHSTYGLGLFFWCFTFIQGAEHNGSSSARTPAAQSSVVVVALTAPTQAEKDVAAQRAATKARHVAEYERFLATMPEYQTQCEGVTTYTPLVDGVRQLMALYGSNSDWFTQELEVIEKVTKVRDDRYIDPWFNCSRSDISHCPNTTGSHSWTENMVEYNTTDAVRKWLPGAGLRVVIYAGSPDDGNAAHQPALMAVGVKDVRDPHDRVIKLSVDEFKYAYVRNGFVSLINLAGEEVGRTVINDIEFGYFYFKWSPDGRVLAVRPDKTTILFLDRQGNELNRFVCEYNMLNIGRPFCQPFYWSPDSRQLKVRLAHPEDNGYMLALELLLQPSTRPRNNQSHQNTGSSSSTSSFSDMPAGSAATAGMGAMGGVVSVSRMAPHAAAAAAVVNHVDAENLDAVLDATLESDDFKTLESGPTPHAQSMQSLQRLSPRLILAAIRRFGVDAIAGWYANVYGKNQR